MTHAAPDLSIVIVNYNAGDVIRECLSSLYRSIRTATFEIIVVDNGSRDGSADLVEREFPDVQLIRYPENRFITPANNDGIRRSRGRYVVILNPDVVALDGSFDRMFRYMEEHRDVGAAGPRLTDADGRLEACCARERTFAHFALNYTVAGKLWRSRLTALNAWSQMAEWQRDSTREVDILADISMVVRRETLENVGLYDETFKLYFAEDDLCRRLRSAGWKVVFLADAHNIHYRHQSVKQIPSETVIRIFIEDAVVYSAKHFGSARTAVLRLLVQITALLRRVHLTLRPAWTS